MIQQYNVRNYTIAETPIINIEGTTITIPLPPVELISRGYYQGLLPVQKEPVRFTVKPEVVVKIEKDKCYVKNVYIHDKNNKPIKTPHSSSGGQVCFGTLASKVFEEIQYVTEVVKIRDVLKELFEWICFDNAYEPEYDIPTYNDWYIEWKESIQEGAEYRCEYCERLVDEDDTIGCYECGLTVCQRCANSYGIWTNEGWICESCRENYVFCDSCEEYYYHTHTFHCEICDKYFCEYCSDIHECDYCNRPMCDDCYDSSYCGFIKLGESILYYPVVCERCVDRLINNGYESQRIDGYPIIYPKGYTIKREGSQLLLMKDGKVVCTGEI